MNDRPSSREAVLRPSSVIARRVLWLERTTSTNDLARELADTGEPEGTVVVTDEQTVGRGRFQRAWYVPPHTSLELSVILRPPIAATQTNRLALCAALAVVQAIRVTTGLEARIKWPNDMVVNDKKCAGILVEAGITEGALEYAILGIGINVNFAIRDYPDLAAHATTLADELGRPIGRDELARNLFDALDEYYARLCQGASLRDEWAGLLITLGQMIRAETPWGIEEGRAVDVDDEGALIVERADGSRVMLVAGEVTIEKQQGSGGAREQR